MCFRKAADRDFKQELILPQKHQYVDDPEKNGLDDQGIRFGRPKDNDPTHGINKGKISIPATVIIGAFDYSAEPILACLRQILASPTFRPNVRAFPSQQRSFAER